MNQQLYGGLALFKEHRPFDQLSLRGQFARGLHPPDTVFSAAAPAHREQQTPRLTFRYLHVLLRLAVEQLVHGLDLGARWQDGWEADVERAQLD